MASSNDMTGKPQGPVKIAVVTNDGVTIAGHFGMAEYYQIITAESGQIISQEKRDKPHHMMHPDAEHASQHDHQDMLAPIRDCTVLLCGGMRTRAYEHAQSAGLQVIMTVGKIDEAVRQYLGGELISDPRRIRSQ
jgi:predicted Fe-Mo cluster-binding NifX family protein